MLEFRKPFNEEPLSPSEIELATHSFQKLTSGLYAQHPETHADLAHNICTQTLHLQAVNEGNIVIASMHHQVNMRSGEVSAERINFHHPRQNPEPPKPDESLFGPKICEYVTGEAEFSVCHFDRDGESQKLSDEMTAGVELTDENFSEFARNTFSSFAMEVHMGLNGGAVGVQEISHLRDLLSDAEPLPYVE